MHGDYRAETMSGISSLLQAAVADAAVVASTTTTSSLPSSSPCHPQVINVEPRLLAGDRGLHRERVPTAFPFFSDVYASLYDSSSPHRGIAVWRVQPADDPLVCREGERPSQLHSLLTQPSRVYFMAWTEFNMPDKDRYPGDGDEVRSFVQLYEQSMTHARPVGAQRFAQWRSDGSNIELIPYMKDMEDHDIWGEIDSSTPIRHFLNTKLFKNDSLNLLRLLSDTGPARFPGFVTPSCYCKSSGSFFCCHVEQLHAPFYNFCLKGSTTWWAVVKADWSKFAALFIHRVKAFYPLFSSRNMTAEEDSLLLSLLYAKRALINPQHILEAGIRVFQVVQQQGDVVIGDGEVVHLGICTQDLSINEAINYLPVSWLLFGLPRLLEWMRWMVDIYIALDITNETGISDMEGATQLIFCKDMRERVSQHVPRRWTLSFLLSLRNALRTYHQQNKRAKGVDFSELTSGQVVRAIQQCDEIRGLLLQEHVRQWYTAHSSMA
jgi:JmjC domain, hydroxylase